MTLALSDYTDNGTVRGLLGISEAEVTDDIFSTLAPGHLLAVTLALEEINAGLPDAFETVKGVAVATRTNVQSRFYNMVRLYASYLVADTIANGSVEMFAPVIIQDGKTAMQTRADDPYTPLRTAIKASLALWRGRLVTAAQQLDSTLASNPTALTLVGSAGLNIDPVTGA